MIELLVLQAVRLKGRVSVDDLAGTVDADPAGIAATIVDLTESGLLVEGNRVRISAAGRERLTTLLADERAHIDTAALAGAYADFRTVNADFKSVAADWQLKDGTPNTHEDADYDAAVLDRLNAIHQRVLPILKTVGAQLPRLDNYATKLSEALAKVVAGDTMWLTRPLLDSYHTVWFELHEELLLAAGLTREGEAESGHAE